MIKELSVTLLLASLATQVSANADIIKSKQEFDGKLNTLSQGFTKSIAQMKQGQGYLLKSRQGIQKKQQEHNLTQPQKQCLAAVLDRTNRSHSLVQNTMNSMNQLVRQINVLKTQVQKSQNEQQLGQISNKSTEIIKQANGLYQKNFKMSLEWDKRVENICSKVASK